MYSYDGWNRITTTRDYLGLTTKNLYQDQQNDFILKQLGPDGSAIETHLDPLGRIRFERTKILGGQWSQINYTYDTLDRIKAVSEPHFGGAANLWNTTTYDRYGRIIKEQLATGKKYYI